MREEGYLSLEAEKWKGGGVEIAQKKEGKRMREGRCRAEVGVDHLMGVGWRKGGKSHKKLQRPREALTERRVRALYSKERLQGPATLILAAAETNLTSGPQRPPGGPARNKRSCE